jgi:hypothetical protein
MCRIEIHERSKRMGDVVKFPVQRGIIVGGCLFGSSGLNELDEGHEQEADRVGAKFGNFGWSCGPDFIHSKTTKGYLFSWADSKTGEISHKWTDRSGRPVPDPL